MRFQFNCTQKLSKSLYCRTNWHRRSKGKGIHSLIKHKTVSHHIAVHSTATATNNERRKYNGNVIKTIVPFTTASHNPILILCIFVLCFTVFSSTQLQLTFLFYIYSSSLDGVGFWIKLLLLICNEMLVY